MYAERGGRMKLVNCTIMHNFAGDGVGGVLSNSMPPEACDPEVDPLPCPIDEPCVNQAYNCILWGNSDGGEYDVTDERCQLYEKQAEMPQPEDWPTADYSCIASDGDPALSIYLGTDNNIGDTHPGEDPGVPVTYDPDTWDGDGWDGSAVYDPITGTTTFTDDEATFSNLENLVLVTRNSVGDEARAIIYSSASHTLVVLGDITAFDAGAYAIEDYRIDDSSPCVDSGAKSFNPHLTDLLGNTRDVYAIDMGCYELTSVP